MIENYKNPPQPSFKKEGVARIRGIHPIHTKVPFYQREILIFAQQYNKPALLLHLFRSKSDDY